MSNTPLQVHVLPNGLKTVIEPIDGARSVSVHLRFEFGGKDDPRDKSGLAALAEATALRGSPGFPLRKILNTLDDYGIDRECSTSVEHTDFAFSCLPQYLAPALRLYGKLLWSPAFTARQLKVARELTEEAILDMEDGPGQKATWLAYRVALGRRLGRHPLGGLDTLSRVSRNEVEGFWKRFRSARSLQVTVTGAATEEGALEMVAQAFGHWACGPKVRAARPRFRPREAETHIEGDCEQTHIRLAYPTAPLGHPLYYAGVLAQTVLSGGSANRLFSEVREKRGLAYQVGAFLRPWRGGALMVVCAGTSKARANETLRVCKAELRRLSTITRAELERARSIVKGYVLTAGELPEPRSGSLAADLFLTGRPRRLSEIVEDLDRISLEQVREFVRVFPPAPLAAVTVGRARTPH